MGTSKDDSRLSGYQMELVRDLVSWFQGRNPSCQKVLRDARCNFAVDPPCNLSATFSRHRRVSHQGEWLEISRPSKRSAGISQTSSELRLQQLSELCSQRAKVYIGVQLGTVGVCELICGPAKEHVPLGWEFLSNSKSACV